MKILIACDCYSPTVNGVVTSVLNLKNALLKKGHQVKILTLSNTLKTHTSEDVHKIGSITIGKLYPGARLRTSIAKKSISAIAEWNPDIIHTQSEFSIFDIAKKLSKRCSAPIVHTYHTAYENYTHYFFPNKNIGKAIAKRITTRITKKADVVVAPTSKISRLLEKYNTPCPIHIAPTGIALERFSKILSNKSILDLKERLGIPQNDFVLLSLSRIGKEKNIEELLHCINMLKHKNISLIVAGDGPKKNELEILAYDLGIDGKVFFTGMVSPKDVPLYYKTADLFVSASTSETQGLTYIEALASGTPLLCKQDDCLAGVLNEGENGYSFLNVEDFVLKINVFMHKKNILQFKENAINTAKKFSRENFAENLLSVYKNCLLNKNNLA